MNVNGCDQRPRRKVALISIIVPVAVCAFAITLASVAQTAAPVPAPSVTGPKVQLKAQTIPALKAGVPTAFNLCSGQPVSTLPAKFTDADGLKMDNKLTPCGEQQAGSSKVALWHAAIVDRNNAPAKRDLNMQSACCTRISIAKHRRNISTDLAIG